MPNAHRSSSHVQLQAESLLFEEVKQRLHVELVKNPRISVSDERPVYIQPDFYSADRLIVGEIFAHIGKPRKAQDNKIANDILKMLLLDEATGKKHRKIIVVCDVAEKAHLDGTSALAESIRRFQIEIMHIDPGNEMRQQVLQAQARQVMINTDHDSDSSDKFLPC